MPIEQDDPCKRAKELRAIRDEIITGVGVVETDIESGNGGRQRVKYSAANLTRLDQEIAAADNACAIRNGKRPRRFAIMPR
ncbi:hypothetical protein [Pararhizobium haloflavum]|uniref:hypothetical protein n=1 Tax=Pararhizobium haloflavum TaxID=2037914 RepID=UPI000C1973A5|nr:hypothetical protein [Pararhizobium haloflavum]